jgi:intein/homing endonuclease
MKAAGKIKSEYTPLVKNGDLAELIGVVLGDGNIAKFPRCDCLRITANGDNQGFVRRYANLVRMVFDKVPTVAHVKASKAVIITVYERNISSRLGIPHGSRRDLIYVVPTWISRDRKNVVRFLRGLYEAEGNYNVHLPTYTHKFQFSNATIALLNIVFSLVSKLGFHPHKSYRQVQISRRDEVQNLKNLLKFRNY